MTARLLTLAAVAWLAVTVASFGCVDRSFRTAHSCRLTTENFATENATGSLNRPR